jgi:hypothetical protein
MSDFLRMPRYDIRNDGMGPYGVFYCDCCNREFRSQPDVGGAVVQDPGRKVAGACCAKYPCLAMRWRITWLGKIPAYSMRLAPALFDSAWKQVQVNFRECPTCKQIVCLSDFDTQSGFCQEDSPRKNEMAEAKGEQTGAAIKGLASAFGLGDVMKNVQQAAKTAQNAASQAARCPNDGTLAAPGTKFCPECGTKVG